jgi:hypothetical protein
LNYIAKNPLIAYKPKGKKIRIKAPELLGNIVIG